MKEQDRDVRGGAEAGRDQDRRADQVVASQRPAQAEHRERAAGHSDDGNTVAQQNSPDGTGTPPRLDRALPVAAALPPTEPDT